MGDAVVVRGARADVEIGVERPGDLGGHELADRLAGDSPHQFAFEKALGDGVVARRRSGFRHGSWAASKDVAWSQS